MLKVLIVHNSYKQRGGEDIVVDNEVQMLRDAGYNVYEYRRTNAEISEFGLIRKLVLPLNVIFSLKTYTEIKRIIQKENIDIVHVHNTIMLISPSVYYAAKKLRCPVVQSVHNFRFMCPNGFMLRNNRVCEDCMNGNLALSVYYKCYRNSYLQSLCLALSLSFHKKMKIYEKLRYLCLTEFNKSKLQEWFERNGMQIDSKKIVVKPNFVTEIKEECEIENELTKYPYFLFVGRLSREKGVDVLLEAWKIYKETEESEYRLLICGTSIDGDNTYGSYDAEKLKIYWLGQQKYDRVAKLMQNAQAVVVPSVWYEGQPMTVSEAFSNGCPVIGSDIGNIRQHIKPGYNGMLFKLNDSDSLKECFKLLDDEQRKTLSEGALETYLQKFTKDINFQILNTVYQNMKNRKVVILSLYTGESGKEGFYNNQAIGIAKAYEKKGYVSYVVNLCKDKKNVEIKVLTETIFCMQVPAKTFGVHGVCKLGFLKEIDASLVHLNADNQFYVPRVIKWCKKNGIPIYSYVGTIESDTNNAIKRFLMRLFVKRNLKCFSYTPTFCKTISVLEQLKSRGIMEARLAPVGLDVSIVPQIKENKQEIRKALRLPLEKTIVLFVGRLEGYKRPEDAVWLLEKLNDDYHLVMIGSGSKRNDIIKEIKARDVSKRITLLDEMPNEEIHKYYKAADCLINVNEKEIFGMCILEAMYHGCPVVARHAAGPDQIIRNGENGYLCSTLEEMVEKIQMVDTTQGVAACKWICENFSWDSTVTKILQVMNE